jgi:ABC-type lipoprotein release transport system permease subunit
VDLMKRNATDHFLSTPENVICVLDGDQKNNYVDERVSFIPFDSVEKQLFSDYQAGNLPSHYIFTKDPENSKEIYNSIKDKRYMTDIEIFEFINQGNSIGVEELKNQLIAFLI